MFLLELRDDEDPSKPLWRVVVHLASGNARDCDFLQWIEGLQGRERDDAVRLLDKLLQVAKRDRGPGLFDARECHHIATARVVTDGGGHRDEKIWELVGSRTRIVWFYGGAGKIAVISHGFVKKGQKTPTKEKNRATALCESYFAARRANQIRFIEG